MKGLWRQVILVSLAGCLICSSTSAYSNKYRLNWDLVGFWELADTSETFEYRTARAGSEFIIVDDSETDLTVVFLKFESPETDTSDGPTDTDTMAVSTDVVYMIARTDIPSYAYHYHNGLSFGTLVVPFKMRSRGRTLHGQSSLGPYVGWRTGLLHGAVTFMATAGLVMIPISDVNSGENENRAGLTYGVGMILETIDRFQIGVVLGADHLGEKDNPEWEYEDNLWISFSIGFGFTGAN